MSKTETHYFAGVDINEFKNMDYDNISNYAQKTPKQNAKQLKSTA